MKFKTLSNLLSKKKTNSRLRKRRAVAEIISTMMLMGVTITGASTLTYFVNDGFVSGNLESVTNMDSSYQNISLLAYDTRDSYSLLSLANVDNENLINKFETRKTVFKSTAVNENYEEGIMKAIKFELLWLKSKKRYSFSMKTKKQYYFKN